MTEVASAYVSLIPSFQGGQAAIAKELGGAGKSGGAAASKSFRGSFMSGLKGLAAPVAGLIGVSAAVDFFKDANAEARDAQKVGALTTSTIKATGKAANVTAKQVGDLAGAISAKTGIDDETIQSGANMLLTFKNIRNEVGKGNDIFNQSTQTLTDLSAAMGTEPKQAAIQLGKALNDPTKGVTALTRVGVTFDAQQTKTIKHLQATGDVMGAQKIILKELNSEFGGAAKAQATAGDKAAVAWGNVKETIGTALLPVVDKVATFFTDKVAPAIQKFVAQVQSGKGVGGKFADAFRKVVDVGTQVADVLGKVIGWMVDNKETVGAFAGVILTVVGAMKVWAAVQAVLNAVMAANPLGLVVIAIAALVAGVVYAYKHFEGFRKVVDAVFSFLKDAVTTIIGFVKDHWDLLLPILLGPFGLLLTLVIKNFDKIKDAVQTAFHAIAAAGKWLWNNALQPVIQLIINGFATLLDWIGNFLGALSHIPGFGWAKDAADKMHDAADKAHDLADAIKDIKDKTVHINVVTVKSTQTKNATGESGDPRFPGNANGTDYWRGGWTWVGERGPELLNIPRGAQIVPNHKIDAAVGGSAVSGNGRRVQLVVGDRAFDAYMREVADDTYTGQRAFARTTRRMR